MTQSLRQDCRQCCMICVVYAGVQSSKLPLHVEGAPNTRSVLGQDVYGSAMPTIEGIRNVLHHVGCDPPTSSGEQVLYQHRPSTLFLALLSNRHSILIKPLMNRFAL